MTAKKRTLIHEDKAILQRMHKDMVKIRPTLDKLEKAYVNLEIGSFTNKIFHEIIEKGTSSIKSKFMSSTEDDIKHSGIKKSLIRKTLMAGAEEEFVKFQRSVEEVKEFKYPRISSVESPSLKLEYITYYDYGAFEIAPEDDEKILEKYCRIYLEGEEEHDTYQKVQEFISVFKGLKTHLDRKGFIYRKDNTYGLSSIPSMFLDFKENEPTIKPSSIRWAVTGQKEWEAEKERQRKRTREYLKNQ